MIPVDALPPIGIQLGSDPTLLRDELISIVGEAILDNPRSKQIEIGPSGLGTPCDKRLGFMLSNTPQPHPRGAAWRPEVGRMVHAGLREILETTNITSGIYRWLCEYKVEVGEISDKVITGSTDVYDRLTATVLDWKICGQASLREYRTVGVSQQYRVQGHLYGRGWNARGFPVERIAWLFLPMAGELHESVWITEQYDESIADNALARASNIRNAQSAVGERIINAQLKTANDHCTYCPWYVPLDATRPDESCPGHSPL